MADIKSVFSSLLGVKPRYSKSRSASSNLDLIEREQAATKKKLKKKTDNNATSVFLKDK